MMIIKLWNNFQKKQNPISKEIIEQIFGVKLIIIAIDDKISVELKLL
jgi:hypothetical protein